MLFVIDNTELPRSNSVNRFLRFYKVSALTCIRDCGMVIVCRMANFEGYIDCLALINERCGKDMQIVDIEL
jgi:hypothetical protein